MWNDPIKKKSSYLNSSFIRTPLGPIVFG